MGDTRLTICTVTASNGVSDLNYFPYEFEGPVEHHFLGTMRYTAIFLPAEIAARLPFDKAPRLRFSGEINDAPIAAAWQPSKGRWYAMLSKPLLRATGLGPGDMAQMRFRLEPLDAVDHSPELERALQARTDLRAAWEALTPGMRRGQVHRLNQAKTSTTRSKRLAEVLAALGGEAPWRTPPKGRPRDG